MRKPLLTGDEAKREHNGEDRQDPAGLSMWWNL
jgi:hypothetical protein